MKEVAKTNGSKDVTLPGDNFFVTYGEATRQTAIVGKLLKFSKGDWMAGESNEPIENGSQFIANMDELLVGWVRWSNNKPTDHQMGRVSAGYQPPRRNELGDTDQDQWEVGEDGQSRDPWQFTNYLLLQDEDKELFTFTTSSTGGRNAIGDLCIKYGKMMRQKPNELPIIELGVGSYMHSNKAFGRIKYPTLSIVSWVPKSKFVQVDQATTEEERGEEADTDVSSAEDKASLKASGKPAPAAVKAAQQKAAAQKPKSGKTRF